MTFGSLFAGIGGLDLGLERAGMTCRWQVESSDYAIGRLETHWPDVRRRRDIRLVDSDTLERVDLIAGGFPCQPVSVAGQGKAQEDRRWLWPQMFRIVRALRPRYVLVENVPGLTHRGLLIVLGDLAGCGYDAEWSPLSACTLGAPHPRERLFVVAYPVGSGRAEGLGPLVQRAAARLCGDDGTGSRRSASIWLEAPPAAVALPHGVPGKLARTALGNAVVPQVAEVIGRAILAADAALTNPSAWVNHGA